jgi:hypothetical protein
VVLSAPYKRTGVAETKFGGRGCGVSSFERVS